MPTSPRYQVPPSHGRPPETEMSPSPAPGSAGHEGDGAKAPPAELTWFRRAKEKVLTYDTLGAVATLGAMIPQGIFGMLLMDKHVFTKKWHFDIEARIAADLLMFAAATYGKYCIVRMYNTWDFKTLPDIIEKNRKTWLGFYPEKAEDRTVTKISVNFADKFATVLISGVFAGLASISWNGAGGLARDMGSDATAEIFERFAFQAVFMLAAFGCNLLAFPNIHQAGMSSLVNWFKHDRGAADKIEKVRLHAKALYEQEGYDGLSDLDEALSYQVAATESSGLSEMEGGTRTCKVSSVGFFDLGGNDQAAIVKYHDDHESDLQVYNNELLGSKARLAIDVLKAVATVVGIVGLYNFQDMAAMTIGKQPPVVGPTLNPGTQWICFGSMVMMTVGTVPHFIEDVAGSLLLRKQKSISIVNAGKYAALMTFIFSFAVLGGTPNAYQAGLAGEPQWMMWTAAVASFLLEAPGLHKLRIGNARDAVAKTDVNAGRAASLDTNLDRLRKIARTPSPFAFSAAA